MDRFGNHLGCHALVHLNCLLSGVADHPAVRALGDVGLKLAPQFDIGGFVEKIVELLQELFTCKQKRRPLFA
jgi:hypothetical protein